MVTFQDYYQKSVAMHHDQARIGPARVRVSRVEWVAHKAEKMRLELQKIESEELLTELKKLQELTKNERAEILTKRKLLDEVFSFLSDKIVDLIPDALHARFTKIFQQPKSNSKKIKDGDVFPLISLNTIENEQSRPNRGALQATRQRLFNSFN